MCNKGITHLYQPPAHEPYLPLLPSSEASPPFGWCSLCLPTKGGQAELTWVAGYIHKCTHWEWNPYTVTHPCTNQAWRRLNLLIETNAVLLCQTTSGTGMLCIFTHVPLVPKLVRDHNYHLDLKQLITTDIVPWKDFWLGPQILLGQNEISFRPRLIIITVKNGSNRHDV